MGQIVQGLARPGVKLSLRAGWSLGLGMLCLWLLLPRLHALHGAGLAASLQQTAPWQWLAALAATAVSFWAVGRYDGVLHRHFRTGIAPGRAARAGVSAIAVSQFLGLGLVTGTALRWRLLPELTLWQAGRITLAVALSFLAGWAVVTAAVLALLPDAPLRQLALPVLALAATGIAFCLLARGRHWPNLLTMGAVVGLAAVDLLAAALALWLLLPAGLMPLDSLLPAFLLAFGAGLVLGTPGGIGPFELTLMALLPNLPPEPLLSAVLGWRLIYGALPAILGMGLALTTSAAKPAPPPRRLLPQGGEQGLVHQGEHCLADLGRSCLVARTGHHLVALHPDGPLDLPHLAALARAENRLPLVYKTPARLAAMARRQGWSIRRTGWEAVLNPQSFRLASSARAGLRRKLRRAEAAGVTVLPADAATAPWPALDRIAADWASHHGGERGFSMGRYARAYVARQSLYVAWVGAQVVGFVTFHTGPQDWALDLMRLTPDAPDGTMHLMVQRGVDDAARAGIARLSLAAVPDGALGPRDKVALIIAALAPETAATGLYRFKASFAPRWEPLYTLAPNPGALALGGLALWRAICRPPPLMRPIEQDDADYEFASGRAAWHTPENTC